MAMNMSRAFSSRFLSKMTRYRVSEGTYNEFNDYIPGKITTSMIWGVIRVGNKFSQFDEGEAIHNIDVVTRISNYKELSVRGSGNISMGDKVGFKGKYYNLLQRSDETVFGFESFMIEEADGWTP